MITNHELVIEYLAQWLADYAETSGKNTFIVGYRGCRADALLLEICSRARKLNSDISTFAHSCSLSVDVNDVFRGRSNRILYDNMESFYLACHRICEDLNGIIVGPIDRTFGLYYRNHRKRAEGTCDIFPLFDLEYQEIVEITNKLWPKIKDWEDNIYDKSKAPLIEFCNEAESKYGIITSEELPNKHPRWPYFIADQKAIIARVHQREKATRHKKIDRPYPVLSDKPQLISRRV